ncbi:hypothetical protein BLNAU_21540 [Blattamonas nauphoetae]|uniref:Protein kinase domain-containing protein n=1 Tax=Blattamonas nauphoetae TaxID=2049346 RepID=A0ABQ9WVM6_9EUKA|nr:hypothetical protein BLNAU_21540 [Blattamonas nauphoetae]
MRRRRVSEAGGKAGEGTQAIDHSKAAVFSLGLILFEIETETMHFGETDAMNAFRQLKAGVLPKMELVQDANLRELIVECLSIEPAKRPNLDGIEKRLEWISFARQPDINWQARTELPIHVTLRRLKTGIVGLQREQSCIEVARPVLTSQFMSHAQERLIGCLQAGDSSDLSFLDAYRPRLCGWIFMLVADPHAGYKWKNGRKVMTSSNEVRTVMIDVTYNILDLYDIMKSILNSSHTYITIQFPYSVPPIQEAGQLIRNSSQNPTQTKRILEWKDLVGYSGYQYDTSSVTISSLKMCWPVQKNGKRKPIQVVAIPRTAITRARHLADETKEKLKDRLHIMGSLYDLFYTKKENRVITLPTLDSKFGKRRKIFIRNCWQEFQIGVIKHFWRFQTGNPMTELQLNTLRKELYPDEFLEPSNGEDQKLWKSIEETPEWISYRRTNVSPFPELINEDLPGDHYYRALYVNGQPGTGKSLMMIYLIYCLMHHFPKLAILYILPNQPVITILVDRLDTSNPIRVRCHPSSLEESYYTEDSPVIRIVDSADPFTNEDMQDIFTIYTASPTQYGEHLEKAPKLLSRWEGDYPFWTNQEFYTMLWCLKMTDEKYWMRQVDASAIVKLHQLVVTLLGAHGSIVNDSDASCEEEDASDMPEPYHDGSEEKAPSGHNTLTLVTPSDLNAVFRLNGPSPFSGTTERRTNSQTKGSSQKRNHTLITTEEGVESTSPLPNKRVLVCLNVIEVFGLSPRALSTDLNSFFRRMSKEFGWGGITLTGPDASFTIRSLTASHYSYRPVSDFTSRLLAAMTRIQAKGFIKQVRNKEIPRALRLTQLEHAVNQELLRSQARFTIFSATPNLFRSFRCEFPSIDRRPLLMSQLADTRLTNNILYYETLCNPLKNSPNRPWKGIDSFIYFLNDKSIELYTFQNAVNSKRKDINFQLIERLKGMLEHQYSDSSTHPDHMHKGKSTKMKTKVGKGETNVEVYFIWVVRPEQVESYAERTNMFQDAETFSGISYLQDWSRVDR